MQGGNEPLLPKTGTVLRRLRVPELGSDREAQRQLGLPIRAKLTRQILVLVVAAGHPRCLAFNQPSII